MICGSLYDLCPSPMSGRNIRIGQLLLCCFGLGSALINTVDDLGRFRAGNGALRLECSVRIAADNLHTAQTGDITGCPMPGNIGENRLIIRRKVQLAAHNSSKLGTGDLLLGIEQTIRIAVDHAQLFRVTDIRIIPRAYGYIRKIRYFLPGIIIGQTGQNSQNFR